MRLVPLEPVLLPQLLEIALAAHGISRLWVCHGTANPMALALRMK